MAADKPGRRVAWVTGASRGVGRGVAVALGQAGWVVYVTLLIATPRSLVVTVSVAVPEAEQHSFAGGRRAGHRRPGR